MSLIAERINKKAISRVGVNYQIIGGQLVPISDSSVNYISKGYNINDVIYSIINLILDKIRLAPWGVYEVVDESSLKSFHAITSKKDMNAEDLRTAKILQTKAFKPVKSPGKWGDLIKFPNEYETFQEFVANGAGYKMLTGNKFVQGTILDAGANKGMPNELYLMPSQWMQIVASTGFPCKVLGYSMAIEGKTFTYEEVLHEKYFNYDYSSAGSHLAGMAPLRAGLRLTNRNNSALDTTTAKFQNGGLDAIIYLDEQGVDKGTAMKQMTALKQSLIGEYTGKDNWGKIAASGYKVGVQNLGLTPVELNIIEAEKWDLRRFCNLLGGVPSQLLNDPENKTYNNQKEGEKALTSRCAITQLSSFRDSINRKAHESWGLKKEWIIDYDMTVFSELQEDMKEMMGWIEPLAKLTAMSPNRILELMGLEKQKDKLFDEAWIRPEMGQPQSEWSMNEVDENLNEDD